MVVGRDAHHDGYGDVVPQTIGGRMIGSMVMVSGILVLALMTGISQPVSPRRKDGANTCASGTR